MIYISALIMFVVLTAFWWFTSPKKEDKVTQSKSNLD